MELKSYGWQVRHDTAHKLYYWYIHLETKSGVNISRVNREGKPHKQAVRNAQAALRRLVKKWSNANA